MISTETKFLKVQGERLELARNNELNTMRQDLNETVATLNIIQSDMNDMKKRLLKLELEEDQKQVAHATLSLTLEIKEKIKTLKKLEGVMNQKMANLKEAKFQMLGMVPRVTFGKEGKIVHQVDFDKELLKRKIMVDDLGISEYQRDLKKHFKEVSITIKGVENFKKSLKIMKDLQDVKLLNKAVDSRKDDYIEKEPITKTEDLVEMNVDKVALKIAHVKNFHYRFYKESIKIREFMSLFQNVGVVNRYIVTSDVVSDHIALTKGLIKGNSLTLLLGYKELLSTLSPQYNSDDIQKCDVEIKHRHINNINRKAAMRLVHELDDYKLYCSFD